MKSSSRPILNTIEVVRCDESSIEVIQRLARNTWTHAYSRILSADQLKYMLETLFSTHTLAEAISSRKQQFMLLLENGVAQGFASWGAYAEVPRTIKLHKIYVLPEAHGKGYGTRLISEVALRASEVGCKQIILNVNRFNKARYFYERIGFAILREEDIPIGPYWMNDYVMIAAIDRLTNSPPGH